MTIKVEHQVGAPPSTTYREHKVFAYRLEHSVSGLGPFEHRDRDEGQVFECMRLGYHSDPEDMADAKLIVYLEKRRHWVYGWVTKNQFQRFCPPGLLKRFQEKGFVVKRYQVGKAHLCLPDGQILFQRPE